MKVTHGKKIVSELRKLADSEFGPSAVQRNLFWEAANGIEQANKMSSMAIVRETGTNLIELLRARGNLSVSIWEAASALEAALGNSPDEKGVDDAK